eukprot:1242611-Rhodomonas_salina.2
MRSPANAWRGEPGYMKFTRALQIAALQDSAKTVCSVKTQPRQCSTSSQTSAPSAGACRVRVLATESIGKQHRQAISGDDYLPQLIVP